MAGFWEVLGKVSNWFPKRQEHRRNRIEDIKKEMAKIQAKKPFVARDADRYAKLSSQLSRLQQQAKNN